MAQLTGAGVSGDAAQALAEGGLELGDAPDSLGAPVVNQPGILSNAFPPDTVGDIGRNHYIQMTNAPTTGGTTAFQIFDKAGNDLSGGPQRFGGLWPAGDPCNSDLGDPIVVYDHLADRWNLSQFARNAAQTQFWMCFAISQTPNPTANTWFIYTIEVPDAFPDYPKVGVWPDGYYMSSYEGNNLGVFVFDRTAMLTGAATMFFKDTIGSLGAAGVRDTRILPADLDGPAPPAGTPNFFVRSVDDQQDPGNPVDRVEIYEFEADFATSTFSFSLVTTLTGADVAPFDTFLCDRSSTGNPNISFRDCIPQPDSAGTIDALSNRPMMQLKYRNFGTHEAMVFNQTIDVSGSINALLGFTPAQEVAGIRWYELRRSGGGAWDTEQQGTYAPQPNGATTEAQLLHRWMGSAAMDKDGNIALGYSIVNDDDTNGQEVFPSIRYGGRRFDDLPGILGQNEQVILAGTLPEGAGGAGQRWGDYSAMSVDPVDDCTFYFTTHVATGAGGKPTRIAAFRYDTCGTDLEITKTDSPDPVVAGGQLRYDITVRNLGTALAEDVVVTDTLPAGVTYVSDTAGCTLAAPTLTCDLGDIPGGGSETITIQVLVSSSAFALGITTLTNTAVVTAASGDTNPANNEATESTTVIERADVQILKTCKPDGPAVAGTVAHCEIQVDNLGLSDARNVVVTDVITSNAPFTVSSATVTPPPGSCVIAPAGPATSVTVTCMLGDMLPGTRKTIRVEFSSEASADVNDTATVTSDTPDLNTANNIATGAVHFAAASNLSISKTDAPDPVVAGTTLTYVITVGNSGPSAAPNVVVRDTVPAQFAVTSVTVGGGPGSCTNGISGDPLQPLRCTLDTIVVGGNRTITVVGRVDPATPEGTVLNNNATVSSANGDPDNSNNSFSATTTVQARADLQIFKTSDKAVYKPSSVVTYTVRVTNNGASNALAAIVTDTLPDLKATIYQSDTGGCTKSANILTCNLGNLAVGESRSFNIYLLVKGNKGTITNSASVTSSTVDPLPANNSVVYQVQVK